jgi:hypothetical protein
MRRHLPFAALVLGLLVLFAIPGRAQITVDLSIRRTIFVAYEPLLATVRITNLSGNRLMLADVEGRKWFGFQIETLDGRPIPPTDPNYEVDPIQIGSGESITRTVNLTQLYPLSDFGSYRIRAVVYSAELSGFFSSPPLTVEVTEGRVMWQQTVGVPSSPGIAPGTRTISLLTHRLSEKTDLYLRIEDKTSGLVYCTHRLGDLISYGKPDIQLDSSNTIHVLQNNVPREFIYSKVGLDGKILERLSYSAPKTRPQLVKGPDGSVGVIGAIPFDARATPTPFAIPKLSDRPAPLPMDVPVAGAKPTPAGGKRKGQPKGTPTPPQQAPAALPTPAVTD